MTRSNGFDQSDQISMLLGAGLAGLGSFGVLTAMVDQRHLDFAPGLAAGCVFTFFEMCYRCFLYFG